MRVLAATHRDLRAEVNAGRFRADLYYRLAVARIVLPPLRERPEDIEPLVAPLRARQLTGVADARPARRARCAALRAHRWTGNVRELRNVVEAAVVMGELDLGGDRAAPAPPPPPPAPRGSRAYRDARAAALAAFEADYLRALIERDRRQRLRGRAPSRAWIAPYLTQLLRKHGLR